MERHFQALVDADERIEPRDAMPEGYRKTLIGITTAVTVGPPDSLERTLVGKARRVIDQRRK